MMNNIMRYELKKIFKCKPIYCSIIIVFVLTILVNLFVALNMNGITRYAIPINTVYIFSSILIFSIFLAISTYILGIEYKFDTMKIIKTKKTLEGKILASKIVSVILYSLVITAEVFIISIIVGMFFESGDTFEIATNSVIPEDQGVIFLMKIFLLQAVGNISIAALAVSILSILKKVEISTIVTIVIMLFCFIASMFVKGNILEYILPFNNYNSVEIALSNDLNMWIILMKRIIYSAIFMYIAYFRYKNLDLE
ncbi:hypothetical protein SAMN04487886_104415 [Clostridium sp. DSM 8431]|uniref:hypothetical protein n=1 Tax=Clostridium sp. DSM 8431 TaxID=1761781 RepID=UPI0008E9F23E|nr:hypothetical protein [Clostridium sp. DSM 8431]SFU51177.1 hypothetical protein SAMN04487886_104415 [Clostridium sp. DSM 8431]